LLPHGATHAGRRHHDSGIGPRSRGGWIRAHLGSRTGAAPVAFIAGVAGPLIGADILHLKGITRLASGMVSIGGAGTFDGIVLSAVMAAYLA